MRSFIVGTAGHIDHGKSSLVKALTGTDPDRLKEEKERGITTDLGFAHVALTDGVVASFIDVPGHEKFVRHMLAGAAGIDAVLLVIAANEGVMPQTREHFHITRLLGIGRGLIVLTKVDAADEQTAERAERDARSLVAGSFLAGAPIVRVSSRTGAGLSALGESLRRLADQAEVRPQDRLLRLPVDRVFTLRGFGTVVTGTLGGGRLSIGDEVAILPSQKVARVRGLQVHGESVETSVAGNRTAVNLAGVQVEDVRRGDVLAREGTLGATRVAHVTLQLLPGVMLEHASRVRVHAGSAEVLGRIRLERDELAADAIDSAASPVVAEVRFEASLVLGRGDRLILRSYSPTQTIGGALVLDPSPRPRRRAELPDLQSIGRESDAEAARRFIQEAGVAGLPLQGLAARLATPVERLRLDMNAVAPATLFLNQSDTVVDSMCLAPLEQAVLDRLKAAHQNDPLSKGLSKEEVRRRLFGRAAAGLFERVIADLGRKQHISESADFVALKEHRVRLSGPDDLARTAIEQELAKAGLIGLSLPNLHSQIGQSQKACENAVRVIVQEKLAERLDGLLVSREALDRFRADARARFASGSKLDVAEVKQLTGLTRKYVIPLLEWLDRERVTRRVGTERIVL